jgi:hypothetical protein
MPKRYFRMGDEDWGLVEKAAAASREPTSGYIRRVLMRDAARAARHKPKR